MSANNKGSIASITDIDVESQGTKIKEKLLPEQNKQTSDPEYLEPVDMSSMNTSEWFWVNVRIFTEETGDMCMVPLQPEEAWPPKWGPLLLFNPLWWGILIICQIVMFVGVLVHYPMGMGLPPRHETRSERRLRIQWIYQFNAYLAVFFVVFIFRTIYYAVNNPGEKLNFFIGSLIISGVWFLVNVYGLYSLYEKKSLMYKQFMIINLVWTMYMTFLMIFEFVNYDHYVPDIWWHFVMYLVFLAGCGYYFNIYYTWNLYGRLGVKREVIMVTAITIVVVALGLIMSLFAPQAFWYILTWEKNVPYWRPKKGFYSYSDD